VGIDRVFRRRGPGTTQKNVHRNSYDIGEFSSRGGRGEATRAGERWRGEDFGPTQIAQLARTELPDFDLVDSGLGAKNSDPVG
jgi:hypothetical protein